MDIRVWFGGKTQYTSNETNIALNKLLHMYASALTRYFDMSEVSDLYGLIKMASLRPSLNLSQKLFLDWMNDKGVSLMNELANNSLPDHEYLRASIEYQIYLLEDETEENLNEMRACLISIANSLPQKIRQAIHERKREIKIEYSTEDFYSYREDSLQYSYKSLVNKESAEMQTLLFIC